MELLRFENLNFTYPNENSPALKDISFSVNKGEFVVVCGKSGCGKSTLLKMIKKELVPNGEKTGNVLYKGELIENITDEESVKEIGYIFQNPDNQIVTDKVYKELAFLLESLKYDSYTIKRKVAEIASYFGIENWFYKNTNELSGGQKQLLNLASITVANPNILLFDEPTSQLDPIAAENFITSVKKLNNEFGITVIMVEHNLENIFSYADKILFLNNGLLEKCATPMEMAEYFQSISYINSLPTALQIFSHFDINKQFPLDNKSGREYLKNNFNNNKKSLTEECISADCNVVIDAKDVWFRYSKNSNDILRGVDLQICQGEVHSILGGNGTGKTTLLKVISGLLRAYRGTILIAGKKISTYKNNSLYRQLIGVLPQNPVDVFVKQTVKEDFESYCKDLGYKSDVTKKKIDELINQFNVKELIRKHPFDLSGGEQQKGALIKVMLGNPKILVLDEPTKAIDPNAKLDLSNYIKQLKGIGKTVVLVTHDIEFAAKCSDKCSMIFAGEIVTTDVPKKFFYNNKFYTTSACKISSDFYDNAVLIEDVVKLCKLNGVKHDKENN